jgi:hypothetical protein
MSFIFQVRPLSLPEGTALTCEGVLKDPVHHARVIDAIIQAAQLGQHLKAEIHLFDADGKVVEVLPVPQHSINAEGICA